MIMVLATYIHLVPYIQLLGSFALRELLNLLRILANNEGKTIANTIKTKYVQRFVLCDDNLSTIPSK